MITTDIKFVLSELSNELIDGIIAEADIREVEELELLQETLTYTMSQTFRHTVIERLQQQGVFKPLRNCNFSRELQQCLGIIRERVLDHYGIEA